MNWWEVYFLVVIEDKNLNKLTFRVRKIVVRYVWSPGLIKFDILSICTISTYRNLFYTFTNSISLSYLLNVNLVFFILFNEFKWLSMVKILCLFHVCDKCVFVCKHIPISTFIYEYTYVLIFSHFSKPVYEWFNMMSKLVVWKVEKINRWTRRNQKEDDWDLRNQEHT